MSEKWRPIAGREYGGIEKDVDLPDLLESERVDLERRKVLRGVLAGMGVALTPSQIANEVFRAPETSTDSPDKLPPEPTPRPERHEKFTGFEAVLKGNEAWWNLRNDQLLLVDNEGAPVGEPVQFETFLIDKRDYWSSCKNEYDPNCHRLTPRESKNWIKYVKRRHAEKHDVAVDALFQRNVNADFKAARNNSNEPALQQGIERGTIVTNLDIVEYFGFNKDKSVPGDAANRTPAEYLRAEVENHLDIPNPVIKEEILKHIVGLAAKESKFNDALPKNSATAEGALQITDDVRVDHIYSEDVNLAEEENAARKQAAKNNKLSFVEQVEVCGKHFSNIYNRMQHWLTHGYEKEGKGFKTIDRPEVLEKIRACFASEEDWLHYGLAPMMINAYNCGSLLMGDVVAEFVKAHGDDLGKKYAHVQNYDLFHEITRYGKKHKQDRLRYYGKDASTYVGMIMAATNQLAKRGDTG
ncbi:hypothetical protein N9L26_02395 [Candidatus Pacebacteria bacterium]|nr:hypothetical protein [Candidatus Paceibacterota bacterium]